MSSSVIKTWSEREKNEIEMEDVKPFLSSCEDSRQEQREEGGSEEQGAATCCSSSPSASSSNCQTKCCCISSCNKHNHKATTPTAKVSNTTPTTNNSNNHHRSKCWSRLSTFLQAGKRRRKSKTQTFCPYTDGALPHDTVVYLKSNGQTGITTEAMVSANASDGAMATTKTLIDRDATAVVDGQVPRETWDKKIDFLLSIIGFAVDLANVWRFPYLCYKNGGGAFLIPYTLMLIFGALPLFYMELILGQFHRQGPISLWKICPILKGTGYCAILVAFYVSFYYNVVIGWSFYFMFASFSPELPWLHCNNNWNTKYCWDSSQNWTRGASLKNFTATMNLNSTSSSSVLSNSSSSSFNSITSTTPSSAAVEYFERKVLELYKSDGVHDLGEPKWELCLCALLAYIILYLALFKGVKASGKVVWVTATMPYVVLTILFVRGLLLPGAFDGLLYFLRPDIGKLTDSEVWVDAAVQVFYSVGVGFGVHLSYASYNNFHNDCFKDCLVTVSINSFTSLFSGLVIFTYLGYMAKTQEIPIDKVATEGPGLVFQVYPEAIATLPGSNFWAFIFFFMLITLGMDSSMGGLESVVTGVRDEFHTVFRRHRYSREIFVAAILIVSFLVALINLTRGGAYMLQWFDTYSAGISLLCSALFEAIAVAWFYGLERFCEDVEEMLGSKPGLFWRICWKVVSPGFLVAVIVCGILVRQPLKYNNYFYPAWVEMIGWGYALSAVVAIPVVAIIVVCKQKGSLKQRIAASITPEDEVHKLTSTGEVRRFQRKHWMAV